MLFSHSCPIAGRLLIRPVVVPIAVHSGLRALVIAGTCMTALQYPLLAAVHGVGLGLFALCLVTSVGDTFYWSSQVGRTAWEVTSYSAKRSTCRSRLEVD